MINDEGIIGINEQVASLSRLCMNNLHCPLLPVLAALVKVLAVGAVAGDYVERFAEHKVLE